MVDDVEPLLNPKQKGFIGGAGGSYAGLELFNRAINPEWSDYYFLGYHMRNSVILPISLLFGYGASRETGEYISNQAQLKELTDKIGPIHQELLPNQGYTHVHPVDLLEQQTSKLEKELEIPEAQKEKSVERIKAEAIGKGSLITIIPNLLMYTLITLEDMSFYDAAIFDIERFVNANSLLMSVTIPSSILYAISDFNSKIKDKFSRVKERISSIVQAYKTKKANLVNS